MVKNIIKTGVILTTGILAEDIAKGITKVAIDTTGLTVARKVLVKVGEIGFVAGVGYAAERCLEDAITGCEKLADTIRTAKLNKFVKENKEEEVAE